MSILFIFFNQSITFSLELTAKFERKNNNSGGEVFSYWYSSNYTSSVYQ